MIFALIILMSSTDTNGEINDYSDSYSNFLAQHLLQMPVQHVGTAIYKTPQRQQARPGQPCILSTQCAGGAICQRNFCVCPNGYGPHMAYCSIPGIDDAVYRPPPYQMYGMPQQSAYPVYGGSIQTGFEGPGYGHAGYSPYGAGLQNYGMGQPGGYQSYGYQSYQPYGSGMFPSNQPYGTGQGYGPGLQPYAPSQPGSGTYPGYQPYGSGLTGAYGYQQQAPGYSSQIYNAGFQSMSAANTMSPPMQPQQPPPPYGFGYQQSSQPPMQGYGQGYQQPFQGFGQGYQRPAPVAPSPALGSPQPLMQGPGPGVQQPLTPGPGQVYQPLVAQQSPGQIQMQPMAQGLVSIAQQPIALALSQGYQSPLAQGPSQVQLQSMASGPPPPPPTQPIQQPIASGFGQGFQPSLAQGSGQVPLQPMVQRPGPGIQQLVALALAPGYLPLTQVSLQPMAPGPINVQQPITFGLGQVDQTPLAMGPQQPVIQGPSLAVQQPAVIGPGQSYQPPPLAQGPAQTYQQPIVQNLRPMPVPYKRLLLQRPGQSQKTYQRTKAIPAGGSCQMGRRRRTNPQCVFGATCVKNVCKCNVGYVSEDGICVKKGHLCTHTKMRCTHCQQLFNKHSKGEYQNCS